MTFHVEWMVASAVCACHPTTGHFQCALQFCNELLRNLFCKECELWILRAYATLLHAPPSLATEHARCGLFNHVAFSVIVNKLLHTQHYGITLPSLHPYNQADLLSIFTSLEK